MFAIMQIVISFPVIYVIFLFGIAFFIILCIIRQRDNNDLPLFDYNFQSNRNYRLQPTASASTKNEIACTNKKGSSRRQKDQVSSSSSSRFYNDNTTTMTYLCSIITFNPMGITVRNQPFLLLPKMKLFVRTRKAVREDKKIEFHHRHRRDFTTTTRQR